MSKECKENELSAAAEKVKHYGFALATVYMCYFTYGIQALILSQNKVNFYTQWGITDPPQVPLRFRWQLPPWDSANC